MFKLFDKLFVQQCFYAKIIFRSVNGSDALLDAFEMKTKVRQALTGLHEIENNVHIDDLIKFIDHEEFCQSVTRADADKNVLIFATRVQRLLSHIITKFNDHLTNFANISSSFQSFVHEISLRSMIATESSQMSTHDDTLVIQHLPILPFSRHGNESVRSAVCDSVRKQFTLSALRAVDVAVQAGHVTVYIKCASTDALRRELLPMLADKSFSTSLSSTASWRPLLVHLDRHHSMSSTAILQRRRNERNITDDSQTDQSVSLSKIEKNQNESASTTSSSTIVPEDKSFKSSARRKSRREEKRARRAMAALKREERRARRKRRRLLRRADELQEQESARRQALAQQRQNEAAAARQREHERLQKQQRAALQAAVREQRARTVDINRALDARRERLAALERERDTILRRMEWLCTER